MNDSTAATRGEAACVFDLVGHLARPRVLAAARPRPLAGVSVPGDHGRAVRDLAGAVSRALGVAPQVLRAVALGALLHDIGKAGIDEAVLRKPAPLTPAERALMRRHPAIGYDMLRGIESLAPALPVVRHHHERWDGGGYPDGLSGKDIPVAARIVSVCDAFDAMTTHRVYRRAVPGADACDEIRTRAGEQFDPEIVAVFVELVAAGTEPAGRAG